MSHDKKRKLRKFQTVSRGHLLLSDTVKFPFPPVGDLTKFFKHKITEITGHNCLLKFSSNSRNSLVEHWRGNCSMPQCPVNYSVRLFMSAQNDDVAKTSTAKQLCNVDEQRAYEIYTFNEHEHGAQFSKTTLEYVLPPAAQHTAAMFIKSKFPDAVTCADLRVHLASAGVIVSADVATTKILANLIFRTQDVLRRGVGPVPGPSVAALQSSLSQWHSISGSAEPLKLVFIGEQTLDRNEGYVPFSCPLFLDVISHFSDNVLCIATDVKMSVIEDGWGVASAGVLVKTGIHNTTIGRLWSNQKVQLQAATTSFLPVIHALMDTESDDNFTKFFNDFKRHWEQRSSTKQPCEDVVRQVHKDYAPGIEAARRACFPRSRPLNDYAHLHRNVHSELQKRLVHSVTEPSSAGARQKVTVKRYLDVALRVYDVLRTVPTIDLFSIIWNAWLETVEFVWKEPDARAYLEGHCSPYTAADIKQLFHIPCQAANGDVLSFGFHWVGLAGTRPGTGSGSQSAEAFHSGWKRDLKTLGRRSSLHDVLTKMQTLYKTWSERLPYGGNSYTAKRLDTNPHLLHSTQLLKIGTNPAYHFWNQRHRGNHASFVDTDSGAAVAVSFCANEVIPKARARRVYELLHKSGADLQSALIALEMLKPLPGKQSRFYLDVAVFVQCFSGFHFVFFGDEARRYHEDYNVLCTCMLFAMHADCPCSQFARALPWCCRSPDIALHPYPTRKDLAAHSNSKQQALPTKADVRKDLRQQLLSDCLKRFPEQQDIDEDVEEIHEEVSVKLKKFRKVLHWEGHWVQCDSCDKWRKIDREDASQLISNQWPAKRLAA